MNSERIIRTQDKIISISMSRTKFLCDFQQVETSLIFVEQG